MIAAMALATRPDCPGQRKKDFGGLNLAIFEGPVADRFHLDLLDALVDALNSFSYLVEKWLGSA
jgi:hypothetical protein